MFSFGFWGGVSKTKRGRRGRPIVVTALRGFCLLPSASLSVVCGGEWTGMGLCFGLGVGVGVG